MGHWEANSTRGLLDLLVGNYYGDKPEERMNDIEFEIGTYTDILCEKLAYAPEDIILEIGSGMGFGSKRIAQKVKHLHCCDISESFLAAAQEQCKELNNITFTHISAEQSNLPYEDNQFDGVFSKAVFIHLNLYDIYIYFSEFQRIVKDGGTVWFNIMDATDIDISGFSQMAGYYQGKKSSLPTLLQWNSPEGIVAIAEHFGFKLGDLMKEDNDPALGLQFIKGLNA